MNNECLMNNMRSFWDASSSTTITITNPVQEAVALYVELADLGVRKVHVKRLGKSFAVGAFPEHVMRSRLEEWKDAGKVQAFVSAMRREKARVLRETHGVLVDGAL